VAVVLAISARAFADDADAKKQVEQTASAWVASFNKQDAKGTAAQYATGGIFVDPTGPKTDLVKYYEDTFKAGINHAEVKVDQAWPLGSDAALGLGKWRVTGKDQNGASMEFAGLWTATYVREAGRLKIRMLTAFPEPQPAK
jgi:ketosteroid isomerase-like protein